MHVDYSRCRAIMRFSANSDSLTHPTGYCQNLPLMEALGFLSIFNADLDFRDRSIRLLPIFH